MSGGPDEQLLLALGVEMLDDVEGEPESRPTCSSSSSTEAM